MAKKVYAVGVFKTQCSRCKSIFMYEYQDCKDLVSDGDRLRIIDCPVCSGQVRHETKFFYQTQTKGT